ncbi:hypothetical protein LEQ41_10220 [Streptococcus agalactiae]|nr:hypothetical protein [Streptococcus agalactiae]
MSTKNHKSNIFLFLILLSELNFISTTFIHAFPSYSESFYKHEWVKEYN